MVFNKFTHLARPSLSKTFVYGYAQSVVAATQSTGPFPPLSKHQGNKASRPNTAQLHTSFSSASTASASTGKASHPGTESAQHGDGGLVAYYEAWQKLQQHGGEVKEWRQYQFPKLIEPRASPKPQGQKGKEQDIANHADEVIDHLQQDQAFSTGSVDGIRHPQAKEEAAAVPDADEVIATVIDEVEHSPDAKDETSIVSPGQQHLTQGTNEPGSTSSSLSPDARVVASVRSTPLSDTTAATSVQDLDSDAFLQHLSKLQDAQIYKDIPPAFESLLAHGIKPTAAAYNALLTSAIHLSMGRHEVVPKALDIYADMLSRKVSPDAAFYSTLITTLSRRALAVADIKEDMELRQKRFSTQQATMSFLFASDEAEYGIVSEDDALSNALTIFGTATSLGKKCILPAETFQVLVLACARHHRVNDMLRVYQHLEWQHVKPAAKIFPAMIEAFARDGDLSSAMECYNEYHSLAVADDSGKFSIYGRDDGGVYAALIKAHNLCGKSDVGRRFYDKIIDSFAAVIQERRQQLEQIRDVVHVEAFIQHRLDVCDFTGALAIARGNQLSPNAREQAFSKICIAAADNGNTVLANKAYQHLSASSAGKPAASLAMLALHVRRDELEAAFEHWATLAHATGPGPSFIEPTVALADALIRHGQVEKASAILRETFARIRGSQQATLLPADLADQIDEGIEVIARSLAQSGISTSAITSLNVLWAMVENGGLISQIAEQMLAGLGPEDVASLGWQDMILTLQAEAGLIGSGTKLSDVAHTSRFGHLLDIAINARVCLDKNTIRLVENATKQLSTENTDLVDRWQYYTRALPQSTQHFPLAISSPSSLPNATLSNNFDPHAATTDHRGSAVIVEGLENHRNAKGLAEALAKFRNIRRSGRHPRYIAYARLITAASKEGRVNLTHDILGMARNDMPFLPEYPFVQHGWSSILDAMVGACLLAGKRNLAEHFHQELLDIGSTPTANTYGLYITTLKESTKTFDEASEAVKIFKRAITEGVLPSSFLYNALIGKLGKARRIDDCLRYFQEMRVAGVRPTSVTYGTIVNALCRVSDERFAEELFDEMESMPNYKPRPAPYNSLMQYHLTTKRDCKKVLAYYNRMQSMNIQPTMHTYKLLIDTHATLEPVNLAAAEGILDTIRASGHRPEAVHYAALIHAKGCALHDMVGARQVFDQVLAGGEVKPQACLYQSLFESMVANHCVAQTEEVLDSMSANRVEMTPYIANTLIHGWAMEHQISKSKAIYDSVGMEKREPSTYESMTRAFLTAEDRKGALSTVHEMLSRGYPSAVSSKILELVSHGIDRAGNLVLSDLIV
ncbi:MAG: hypothetical protein Q9163_004996 [Psora crenata]